VGGGGADRRVANELLAFMDGIQVGVGESGHLSTCLSVVKHMGIWLSQACGPGGSKVYPSLLV
jgi:hypothetical protein